jgi:O-acetyl-ADP-ribose deacetylase (regulator of RNase III)
MNEIIYLNGDATHPKSSGPVIIVHICNDVGGWGAGFVLAISKRWSEPERRFRAWFKKENPADPEFGLGKVQIVDVEPGVMIANLIGQHGLKRSGSTAPIRYEAVEQGLREIAGVALKNGASIHMPRIGCGLAGGSWDKVEPLILKTLIAEGLGVTVYDFAPA